jgi:hypothetical protein
MAALARLYEPLPPASVVVGDINRGTGQGSLFGVRSCLDCAQDCFGKGRKLCRPCATKRRHTEQHRRARSQTARARHAKVEREPNLHWRRLYEEDGPTCRICLWPVVLDGPHGDPCSPAMDHIIPMAKGGTHTRANVQLAHMACNSYKRDLTTGLFGIRPSGPWSVVPLDWVSWECRRHARCVA